METQLRDVNARFARLYGMSGAHALDLYGRTNLPRGPAAKEPEKPGAGRRPGKRLPISSSAQVRFVGGLLSCAVFGDCVAPPV